MKVLKNKGFRTHVYSTRYKRESFKHNKLVKEISQILYKHIQINAKDYLILSIILIIGVMIGVFIINNLDENSRSEINGYINGFINIIKNENFEVDKMKLTQNIMVNNIKIIAIIWISGTTIIGIPLIYIITIYKGISIGYTVSAIMLTMGNVKGLLFSISALLLQNIIIIPVILMLNVSSLRLYRNLIKRSKTVNIKAELIKHTIICFSMIIPIIIASFISSFFSSNLICYILKG